MSNDGEWIREARGVLKASTVNFFRVNPWQYWFDFILSLVLGYAAGTVFLSSALGSWPQLIAFPFAVFWLYRLGSLVHEVAHLGQHEMRFFKVTWNLLVGVVTLSPSPFFTQHHRDHHSARLYGTPEDPEYASNLFPALGRWSALVFALEILLLPLMVFARFLLAPLTFISPRLRDFFLRRGASLTLNWRYERRLTAFDRWAVTAVELLCWLRATMIPLAVIKEWVPWSRIPLLYLLGVSVVALNQLRLLADHHLESDGKPLTLDSHILDSCNYAKGDWLTWLFFPFAIRFHALHHMFPSLPYHNLEAAHTYLLAHVSPQSPYRTLDRPGWWSVAQHAFRIHPTR